MTIKIISFDFLVINILKMLKIDRSIFLQKINMLFINFSCYSKSLRLSGTTVVDLKKPPYVELLIHFN